MAGLVITVLCVAALWCGIEALAFLLRVPRGDGDGESVGPRPRKPFGM